MTNTAPAPDTARDHYFVSGDTLADQTANISLCDSMEEVDSHIYCQPKLHYQGNPTKFYVVNIGKSTGISDDWEIVKTMVIGFPHNDHKSFSDFDLAIDYWRKHCRRAHNHATQATGVYADACLMHGLVHVHMDQPIRLAHSHAATVDTSYPTSSISPGPPPLIPDPDARVFYAICGRRNVVFSDRERAFRAFEQEVELGYPAEIAFELSLAGAERFIGEAPEDD